ncbi:MAG: DUF721 domain-containing protein [Nitrospinae bacterium]|nr:DUF721 domain-containing protein [Nitrospinota bacterium]
MSRQPFSKPRRFSSILREVRRKEPWGKRLARNFVFRIWPKAVGEGISRAARPVSLRKGCLFVEVANSSWLYELELRKQDLLARINERMEDSRIDEIRFRLSNDGFKFDYDEEESDSVAFPREATPISSGDEAAIGDAIADVEDEQLQSAAKKLINHIRTHRDSLL